MTSFDPFEIGFYFDNRSSSESKSTPGTFPIKLRVYSNNPAERKKKLFGLKKNTTPSSWSKISKSFLGSSSGLNTGEKELREFLLGVRQEAQKLNNPSRAKTLKQFSDLFNSNSNSDTETLRLWDRFDLHIEKKINAKKSEGTIKAYKDAKRSLMEFDKDPNLLMIDVDYKWLHEFIEYHEEMGNSRESAKSYLRQMKAVYTSAWKKGIINGRENPFHDDDAPSLDPGKRKTKYFSLTEDQIHAIAKLEPTSFHMTKAKDVFLFLFSCAGMRFSDMIVLEHDWIYKDDLGEKFDFDPEKTKGRTSSKGELWITPQMREIMNKYPGNGKYVFDFIDEGLTNSEIKRKKHSLISNINENLTKLVQTGVNLPERLSTYHARYGAASYMRRKTGASSNEVSEQMVNSPKMAEGYIHTPEIKKEMQSVLSDVLKENQKSSKKSKY